MHILLNSLLSAAGLAGTTWYMSSSAELWPMLAYFIVLGIVGTATAIAFYVRARSLRLLTAALNGMSILLLIALQTTAFAVSPGSAFAVAPFIAAPLAINLISLRWTYNTIKR